MGREGKLMADDMRRDDRIQHGIDDSPEADAEKGAALGGIGGAAVGAAAGAALGPLGAIGGAVIGAVAGAAASGLAVAAVDRVDNDNTVSGMGEGVTPDVEDQLDDDEAEDVLVEEDEFVATRAVPSTAEATAGSGYATPMGTGSAWPSTAPVDVPSSSGMVGGSRSADWTPGNDVPGIQTGGRAADGTPDTRGITEKASDLATGDRTDDKTGKPV
jgi:hypothetical protein